MLTRSSSNRSCKIARSYSTKDSSSSVSLPAAVLSPFDHVLPQTNIRLATTVTHTRVSHQGKHFTPASNFKNRDASLTRLACPGCERRHFETGAAKYLNEPSSSPARVWVLSVISLRLEEIVSLLARHPDHQGMGNAADVSHAYNALFLPAPCRQMRSTHPRPEVGDLASDRHPALFRSRADAPDRACDGGNTGLRGSRHQRHCFLQMPRCEPSQPGSSNCHRMRPKP